jgi:hypothetical protein
MRRAAVTLAGIWALTVVAPVALTAGASAAAAKQKPVPRAVLGTLNHVIYVQAQPGLKPRDRAVFTNTFGSEWQDAATQDARIAKHLGHASPSLAARVTALSVALGRVAQCWSTDVPDFLSTQDPQSPFIFVDLAKACGAPRTHPNGGLSPWIALDQAVAALDIRCKAVANELECGPNLRGAALGVPHALFVGDCFTGDIGQGERVVDCTDPHNGEVFSLSDYPADQSAAFPGMDAIHAYAVDRCSADFTAYVGVDADTSKYDHVAISSIAADTWKQGVRSVLCYLVSDDKQPTTGSAKGTAL